MMRPDLAQPRTSENSVPANFGEFFYSRTSWNPQKAKFAEFPFHALG